MFLYGCSSTLMFLGSTFLVLIMPLKNKMRDFEYHFPFTFILICHKHTTPYLYDNNHPAIDPCFIQ